MKMQINSKLNFKILKILHTSLTPTEDPNNHQFEGTQDYYQPLSIPPHVRYGCNRPFCAIDLLLNNGKWTVFLVSAATQSASQHMSAIASSQKQF